MTALAALIGLIEGDTRVAWRHYRHKDMPDLLLSVPATQFSRDLHPSVPMTWEPITVSQVISALELEIWKDFSISLDAAHTLWRDRIAASVQFEQVVAGIPIRTIQEAIDAGEYAQ